MSRCFAIPPTGYARNWGNGQNLVESTKHERDIVGLEKALRKEKKEKERRKQRKEKKQRSHKAIDGHGIVDDKGGQLKHHPPPKEVIDLSEQVEKSGLTEEHEQPQNLCYLSDGTQSNKRKREEPPAVECRSQGKPLRIRFVFRKPKEPEALPNEQRVCSTSGAELSTPTEKVAHDTRSSGVASTSLSEQEERLPSISSRENDGSAAPVDTRKKKHKPSKEARYEALFRDWVPPVMPFAMDNYDGGDDDWLFRTKKQEKPLAAKRAKADEDMNVSFSCGGSSWPRAQFLPRVGIHSLPYTIPF